RRARRLSGRARPGRRRNRSGMPGRGSDPRRRVRTRAGVVSSGSVHLVRGDDPVLRGAAVDRLVSELLEGEPREFALEDYTIPGRRRAEEARDDDEAGDAGVVQAVVTALASPPFVTARRVVVVHEVGALNAASAAAIAPFVAQPSDGIAL